ncbi:hypothetical protein BB560_001091 [Smittium megazygosporum]|uniref:Uncharacterized protein n=1 Tax=Smittium megazygosporum TaxID=133381 RepID=A0A2T9ZIT1_9FUNG|nr:hypothetical protein BB560_001091 [Smittium megazygosporum]
MSSRTINGKKSKNGSSEADDTWEEINSHVIASSVSQNSVSSDSSDSIKIVLNLHEPSSENASPISNGLPEQGSVSAEEKGALVHPRAKSGKSSNNSSLSTSFASTFSKVFKSVTLKRMFIISITTFLLPFVSGAMMGLGEIFAHQLMFNLGWMFARPIYAPGSVNTFFR